MGKHKSRSDDLSLDKYRSPTLLDPKSSKVKQRYFKIYEEYVLTHSTERELAEKYNYGIQHISGIIKWVVSQTEKGDNDVYFRTMVDKISHSLQELECTYQKEETTVKEKVMLRGEIRRHFILLGKIQKLLGSDINIDMSNKSKTLTIVTKFDRGNHIEGGDKKETIDVEPDS
jgi:hypothetical protein